MASGDIKRMLDFGDVVLIHEATAALFNDILQQRTKQKIDMVTAKNQHLVPSLSLLWSYLSGSNPVTSRSFGILLVRLLKTKVLDSNFAQEKLLCMMKVAKCPHSILCSITDLLLASSGSHGVEVMEPKHIYRHPFVQFYRVRPLIVSDILACARRIGTVHEDFSSVIPPIAFLLLWPDAQNDHKNVILTWIFEQLTCTGMDSAPICSLWRFLPLELDFDPLHLLLKSESIAPDLRDEIAFANLDHIFGGDTVEGHDLAVKIRYLQKAVLRMRPNHVQFFSVRLSSCLLRLPYNYWPSVLEIVEQAWKRLCPIYSSMFFAPLVSLNTIIDQLKSIGLENTELLDVQKAIPSYLASMKPKRTDCVFHKNGDNLKSLLDVFCRFPQTIPTFLRALTRLPLIPNDVTLNLLSSLLILNPDDDAIVIGCCDAILKMVAMDPTKVSLVFPSFIQTASRELTRNEAGKTVVLDFIPKLAVHYVCTPTVLRFILSLVNHPKAGPKSNGYRLLGILFEKQPFIFREIKSLFEDVVTTNDEQVLLLKMELLFVVCKISGADHADYLATTLTSVVNKREASSDIVIKILNLAVLSLGELCRCEELDPSVTWKQLHGKLSRGSGQLVPALCDFAGLIGEIIGDDESMVMLKVQLLYFLCKLALSQKTDSVHRAAALRALSKFNFVSVDAKQLGIELSQMKQHGAKADETEDEGAECRRGIWGDALFDIFDSLDDNQLEAFRLLLSKLVSTEVESLGRGAYYNAKLMASKQASSSSSLDNLCTSLIARFSEGGDFVLDKNIAVSLLLVYEPPQELAQRGGGFMRKSISAGRNYLQVLGELLKMVPFGDTSDWKRALIVPFGWIRFMERLYAAVILSRRTELEIPTGADNRQEVNMAYVWARDKIVEHLKMTWRQDCGARSNCCLALAALCLAVKNHLVNNSEATTTTSNSAFMDNRHWITLVAETLFGLSDTDYAPTSQDRIFEFLDSVPDATIVNASRLAIGILLPEIREDIIGFYGEQILENFGAFLASRPASGKLDRSSDHYATEFYNSLSLGFYGGGHSRHGSAVKHYNLLLPNRYENVGSWFGAAIHTVFADDIALAESLLDIMIPALGRIESLDREAALHAIGLISIVICPDPSQFAQSDLPSRLDGLYSGDGTSFPGYLSKIYGGVAKDGYRQTLSAQLSVLTKENATYSEISSAFRWLCSSCGGDSFISAHVGRSKKLDTDDRKILNDLCRWAKTRILSKEGDEDQECKSGCMVSLASVAFSTRYAVANSTEVALPIDYSYLDEQSILRRSIDFLIDGSASGRKKQFILKALTSSSRVKSLPPLDWDRVYDSMETTARSEMDDAIVSLAIRERASALLRKLIHPTSVLKLSSTAKMHLLENLHVLAGCLSSSDLARLLRMIPKFKDENGDIDAFLTAAFRGLRLCFSSSKTPEKDRAISMGNLDTLSNWMLDICPFLRVESYNDFRVPVVQQFVEACVEMEMAGLDNLIRSFERRSALFAFAIQVSTLLRRSDGKLSLGMLNELLGAYERIGSFGPSALRILMHELASCRIDLKEKEAAVLNLMNMILLHSERCAGDASGESTIQINSVFGVFLAAVAVWFRDHDSLPPYLLDHTKVDDELNTTHDSLVVSSALFADAATRFAKYLCVSKNSRLTTERVIGWALQLMHTAEVTGDKICEIVCKILEHCRSTDAYICKLEDFDFAAKIVIHALKR